MGHSAALLLLLGASVSVAQPPAMRVLDGHVHISNTSLFDYLWANASAGVCPCAPPCLCNWTTADYAAATASFPTEKFVFVEVDVNTTQWLAEAQWVQSLADAGAAVGGIVSQPPPGFGVPGVDPAQLEPDFRRLAALPLARGIRGAGINWTDPATIEIVIAHGALLERFGLSLDIITSVGNAGVADSIARVATALRRVNFVIDHVGGPPVLGSAEQVQAWTHGIALIGALPNVYVKIGGIFQDYKSSGVLPTLAQVTPFVTGPLASFGFDRSLFEGNWFFVNWYAPADLTLYSVWAKFLTQILDGMGATQAQRDALYWRAGSTVYRVA